MRMNLWTCEDISKILIQLDKMCLPFSKYAICQEEGKLKLLGRGGFAEVYEAQTRTSQNSNFALKVIGFGNQNVDSDFFNESVQVQKDVGGFQDDVVKIYDHTEIWVTLDEKDNVIEAVKEKPNPILRTTIKLQFILMEKIASVLTRTKAGNIRILPAQLAQGDEQEILKLAYDIGLALRRAHDNNVIHRDVKLENVFYSEKKKQYKLGDFGIAKKTENGFAGTVAFTRGYAAPEVRVSEDRYDNTADIYSFGMMLYVLSNNLKFPDSDTYNANLNMQYEPGYIVPYPERPISAGLYNMIVKACMYDPNQRYQSMEEMLLDIDKLMYGTNMAYRKEHKAGSLVAGIIMLAFGVMAWKLTMAQEAMIKFSLWEYIFLAGGLAKGIFKAFRKETTFISIFILGVGIYLISISQFSWIKLLFLFWMTFSSGTSSGCLSGSILIANLVSMVQQTGEIDLNSYSEYNWVPIAIISIAMVLLYQYEILDTEDRKIFYLLYKRGMYWIMVCLMYVALVVVGCATNLTAKYVYNKGDTFLYFFSLFDATMVGLSGLGFCLIWIVRENIFAFRQKNGNT